MTTTSRHRHEERQPSIMNASPWLRKPLWYLEHEIREQDHQHLITDPQINDKTNNADLENSHNSCANSSQLHRHLNLFDLVSIGVGGTIGSGIFVLSGLIAREYAGPATCLSWLIAGVAAALSGCCYAELSGRIPSAGSSYAYVYAAIGELPAVIAAACLTLEYVVSGSAVARSWGDKMVDWLKNEIDLSGWMLYLLDPGFGFNPLAFLISLVSTLSLLQGVKESKSVTNFFTSVKVILVMYMIVGGAFYFQSKNLTPFIPKSMGMSGMMRGATSSFFGYIGYDEVCCVAGEAINPQKNMPRAVMLTIGIVTLLTVLASFSLVGMQPYFDISATSGFPEAFRYNDAIIASQICAFGEIFTLPIVVLITLMAQPRLGFALAKDGLLPEIFGEVNESGNIFKGTLIFGALMTFIAAFMPFAYLDDLISGGILIAFSMTNSSLVILRHESPDDKPFLLQKHLFLFNFFSLLTGLSMKNLGFNIFGQMITFALAIITLWISLRLARKCPQSVIFGGKSASQNSVPFERENGAFYKVPFVPYLPCMGIFINWYLVAQLQLSGFVLLILYISGACIFYYKYGIKHSRGNAHQWKIYNTLGEVEQDNEHMFGTYARTISLPRRKSQTHLT